MKINSKQRAVLAAIQLDAELGISEIARLAGLPSHTVQYNLSRLKAAGVLRTYCFINPHRLGLTDFCLFLNPIGFQAQLLERMAQVCATFPGVAYATQLVGEFLFSVSCFGKDVRIVDTFLSTLHAAIPDVTWDVEFAVRLEWTVLQRATLGTSGPTKSLTRSVHVDAVPIDATDIRLLTALSQHPELALSRVSNKIGISEATGRSRFKKLSDTGVILGKVCYVPASSVGCTEYRILISVAGRTPALDAKFRQFALENEMIHEFVICIGGWSYELNAQATEPANLGLITGSMYKQFRSHIQRVQTMSNGSLLRLHQMQLEPDTPLR